MIIDMVRCFTIHSVYPHAHGGGWMLTFPCGSMIFCPHDRCSTPPERGEEVTVTYHGNTFRVVGIIIGEPPRDYGAVG